MKCKVIIKEPMHRSEILRGLWPVTLGQFLSDMCTRKKKHHEKGRPKGKKNNTI